MLAEPVGADRALSLGLVNSVVADDELPAAAAKLAGRLADGPTLAYGGIKEQLAYAAAHGLAESLEYEAQVQGRLGQTADHQAATAAFLGKRQPVFEGR
jgi:2-(1,2-epoxy-1,2-dihydrophenyl)acetyl-CoA isomerase